MPAAGITLTERAAVHVRQFMQRQREDGGRLRVGVKDAGCSGYRYVVETAREVGANDRVFRSRGRTDRYIEAADPPSRMARHT